MGLIPLICFPKVPRFVKQKNEKVDELPCDSDLRGNLEKPRLVNMDVLSQVEAQNVPVLVASNVVVGRFPVGESKSRGGLQWSDGRC